MGGGTGLKASIELPDAPALPGTPVRGTIVLKAPNRDLPCTLLILVLFGREKLKHHRDDRPYDDKIVEQTVYTDSLKPPQVLKANEEYRLPFEIGPLPAKCPPTFHGSPGGITYCQTIYTLLMKHDSNEGLDWTEVEQEVQVGFPVGMGGEGDPDLIVGGKWAVDDGGHQEPISAGEFAKSRFAADNVGEPSGGPFSCICRGGGEVGLEVEMTNRTLLLGEPVRLKATVNNSRGLKDISTVQVKVVGDIWGFRPAFPEHAEETFLSEQVSVGARPVPGGEVRAVDLVTAPLVPKKGLLGTSSLAPTHIAKLSRLSARVEVSLGGRCLIPIKVKIRSPV